MAIDIRHWAQRDNRTVTVPWSSTIDVSQPCWVEYRGPLQGLGSLVTADGRLPGPAQLQQILPSDAMNQLGLPIRFLSSASIPGVAYEEHIFNTGEVSTREDHWHDLFNALVWSRFPRLKSALNAVHYCEIQSHTGPGSKPGRGPVRDALTLFDECGVIVVSDRADVLAALAQQDWTRAFCVHKALWNEEIGILICGHALLQKLLQPYKALSAHALLLQTEAGSMCVQGSVQLEAVDAWLAGELLSGTLLRSPADLSPLPLMGIPGWWSGGEQDEVFYADRRVFRAPPPGYVPAPIFAGVAASSCS